MMTYRRCYSPSLLVLAGAALAQPAPPDNTPDATLRSTPETVVWGYFAADIAAGVAHQVGPDRARSTPSRTRGVNTGVDPVTFFGRAGIPADQVLKDAIDIYEKVTAPARARSAHILTGPIYVEEAAPGDMLEVRILALEYRVPYGVNNSNRGTGVLPDLLRGPAAKVIRFDTRAQRRAVLARDRDSAAAVHGHHGGRAAARHLADQLAAAGALRRQHGLQQAHGRRDALSAGVPRRRAVLHRRLARRAGRRRDQRHRDRGLAHRHVPVHRAQGRRRAP